MLEQAVLIALTGALNALTIVVIRSKRVHALLGASIFFAQLQWYTIPAALSITLPSVLHNGWAARLSADQFYLSLALEMTVAISALSLLLIALKVLVHKRGFQSEENRVRLPYAYVLAVVSMMVCAGEVVSTGFDYLKINAAAVLGDERSLSNTFLGALTPFSLAYLVVVYLNHQDRRLRFLIMLALVSFGIARFFAGSRIMIALPLFVYVFGNWHSVIARPGRALAVGAIVVAGAVSLMPLVIAMGNVRQTGHAFTVAEVSTAAGEAMSAAAAAVFGKYDGSSTGEFLVSAYGAGSAGFTPYIGSLLIFVPRAIVPGRPVPGSYDGTYSGHPTRLVPALVYYDSPSYNVGILPGHIAVWHMGYIGLVIASVVLAAYFFFLNGYFGSASVWRVILAFQALSMPSFHTVFTSPDVVLRNMVVILLATFGLATLRIFFRRRSRQLADAHRRERTMKISRLSARG